jgi:hypothetical protein
VIFSIATRRLAARTFCAVSVLSAGSALPLTALMMAMPAQAKTPRLHAVKPAPADNTPYTVLPHDNLFDLATRYLIDSRDWIVLQRLNHVANPRHLAPGSVLQLPTALLKQNQTAANVVAVRGAVFRQPANGDRVPMRAGGMVAEGDEIATGRGAFASIVLPDGSHVVLPSNSRIAVTRLRETVLTHTVERRFDLKAGEASAEVTPFDHPRDSFQIIAPSVVAGVRGTRFRVDYLADRNESVVEVFHGRVAVDAASDSNADAMARRNPLLPGAAENVLSDGYGSVTRTGASAGAAVKLLEAPKLVNPAKIQYAKQVTFDLMPVAGAASYRAEIATDAGFLDVIADQRGDAPHFTFDDVPEGSYFVRISAIDTSRIGGEQQIYAFDRWLDRTHAEAKRLAHGGYAFRWITLPAHAHFRFVLSTHSDLSLPLIDLPGVADGQVVVSSLQSGTYYWAVVTDAVVDGAVKSRLGDIQSFNYTR